MTVGPGGRALGSRGADWPRTSFTRLVELDPKTGKRLNPAANPLNIAINSEAAIMIYHDGWYYLLVTHGSCCRGADSGYNT